MKSNAQRSRLKSCAPTPPDLVDQSYHTIKPAGYSSALPWPSYTAHASGNPQPTNGSSASRPSAYKTTEIPYEEDRHSNDNIAERCQSRV